MNPSKRGLPRAVTLRTYDELDPWMAGFVASRFHLLFLVGRPGLGKSRRARQALEGRDHAWVDCHATKLAVYAKLYKHRDEPVVIDDENTLISDPGKLSLVNALCQTDETKTLRWDSTTRLLQELGLPAEFTTSSPVLVITNQVRALGPQVRAMIDRGLPLQFQPGAREVHEAVADWFPERDRDVYDFIGQWLAVVPGVSMRDYVKAAAMKAAGMDWRGLLHRQWKSSRLARVAELRADRSFSSEEERVRAFVEGGLGSRATYFRHVSKLQELGPLPVPDEASRPHADDAA